MERKNVKIPLRFKGGPSEDGCEVCGRTSKGLMKYSEYSHSRACTMKDIEGVSRKTIEPVFTPVIEMCYPCFKNHSKKYVLETKAA